MSQQQPARGLLTFEAEGNDAASSPWYSRRLHWPKGASGVTIGRGYDMRHRTAAAVKADLIAAGVSAAVAEQYSGGAGLHGSEAETFVEDHRDEYDELTWAQQLALFETVYDEICQDVRRISNKQDVIDLYGSVDWDHVDQRILDVIVDLRYRGDYTSTTRQEVQEPFAENDFASFREVMRNETYWVTQRGVPQDRFNRRRDYLPEGTGAAAGTVAPTGQGPFDLQRMSEAQLYDHLLQVWRRARRRFGHEGDSVYEFQEQNGRVNLIGARGFRRDTMKPCVNTANTWDDTMFAVYKDAAGQKKVRTFTLSTEPNTEGGVSFLKVGMHKYWLNYHKKSKPKVSLADHVTNWPGSNAQYRALNPLGGVSTFLDNDGDLQQDTGESDESDAAINVHYGGAGDSPSGWSKGCQVIKTWADYRAFIELVESDHSVKGSVNNELASKPSSDGTRAVIYLLVEGSELRPVGLSYPAEGERAGALYQLNEGGEGGFFPIGANNFWHGGVHLDTDEPICAIADGRLVAYRINQAPLSAALGGQSLEFSNGFALVRHELTTPKGTAIRFFSLYMHLLPLDGYTDEQRQKPPAFLVRRRFFVASAGLNVRENGSGTTVLRTLAKDAELTFKEPHLVAPNGALADGWFELADGGWVRVRPGGDNPTVRCETQLGAATVDAVVAADLPIAAGEILGYPGPYLTRPATVHFEIFTDDAGFMDNPNADEGGRRTLVIPAGTCFMQRVAAANPPVSVNLPPGSRLRFLEKKEDNRRVVCEEIVGWAPRSALGSWNATTRRYTLESALATLYVACPSGGAAPATVSIDAPAGATLRYVSQSGDYRRVGFTVPEDRRADLTGWAPRGALGDYAGSHYTLTAILASIQAQDPAGAYSFEGDAGSSERELLVDVPEQAGDPALCKDADGKVWQEVELAPGQRGWIAHDAEGVAVKSSFDWPRWRRLEEAGGFSDDGLCDAPELIGLLDADGDRKIARDEIRAALADPAVGPRLRRLAVKHPSEWSAESGGLDRLKEAPWFLSDEEIQATEAYIEQLRFWEDAGDAGLPAAGAVWHLHPIGFVEHLNEMLYGIREPEEPAAPVRKADAGPSALTLLPRRPDRILDDERRLRRVLPEVYPGGRLKDIERSFYPDLNYTAGTGPSDERRGSRRAVTVVVTAEPWDVAEQPRPDPRAGVAVRFRLGPGTTAEAALSAEQATTDEEGRASVEVIVRTLHAPASELQAYNTIEILASIEGVPDQSLVLTIHRNEDVATALGDGETPDDFAATLEPVVARRTWLVRQAQQPLESAGVKAVQQLLNQVSCRKHGANHELCEPDGQYGTGTGQEAARFITDFGGARGTLAALQAYRQARFGVKVDDVVRAYVADEYGAYESGMLVDSHLLVGREAWERGADRNVMDADGLLDIYRAVVWEFIERAVARGHEFAELGIRWMRHPDDDGPNNPPNDASWPDAVTQGVAYTYGGGASMDEFTAALNGNDPGPDEIQSWNQYDGATTTNTGAKIGLHMDQYNQNTDQLRHYTGIDCSAFVQRCATESTFRDEHCADLRGQRISWRVPVIGVRVQNGTVNAAWPSRLNTTSWGQYFRAIPRRFRRRVVFKADALDIAGSHIVMLTMDGRAAITGTLAHDQDQILHANGTQVWSNRRAPLLCINAGYTRDTQCTRRVVHSPLAYWGTFRADWTGETESANCLYGRILIWA